MESIVPYLVPDTSEQPQPGCVLLPEGSRCFMSGQIRIANIPGYAFDEGTGESIPFVAKHIATLPAEYRPIAPMNAVAYIFDTFAQMGNPVQVRVSTETQPRMVVWAADALPESINVVSFDAVSWPILATQQNGPPGTIAVTGGGDRSSVLR